ncbi:hypothetical protein EGI22_16365 [Lacihabitans sp. LS3-19]|uniref:hypothetical protein n=1 Tax=Lacihabitans sp. LS3-19 TaxID=2487335 RepID=UPI0020CF4F89|nr:hypothetical protein [Lacihabitans sp. LS3-19]MCP9769479.1 hypothetical protein [Lacihabitans sp. LS3-19]
MKELKNKIRLFIFQQVILDLLKCLFVSFSLYFISFALFNSYKISAISFLFGFIATAIFTKLFKDKTKLAQTVLHKNNPQIEYSLSLLFKDNLNAAETLQAERINEKSLKIPFKLDKIFWLLLAFLGLSFFSKNLKFNSQQKKSASIRESILTGKSKQKPNPKFISSKLKIVPPSYTALPTNTSENLNAEAIIGSKLEWTVIFENAKDLEVYIENAKGKNLVFSKIDTNTYRFSDLLVSSSFYSIKAQKGDSTVYQSEFYRIEAIPDAPPKIEPVSKELYQFHKISDPTKINVSAKISDDFRVKESYIVATVARGSGENVKFREVKWPVGSKNFKSENISKTIDLKSLGFAPGDELYYYWAAFDNKSPEPNFSKSDTYFVVFKDTAANAETDLATMAMNILPEYFRSQRQIIIDTEKLIKKKNKIKKQEFNSESNEIGYDQKILRLRYGQYLGEEFETSIGPGGHDDEDGDFMKGFVHAHDSEEQEDNHVEAEHHDHGITNPNADQDPLAAMMAEYVHSHDDADANTFYEQSTRSLLKMALEQMWQSELHLRLYEPEKALPFENKALAYLKEAQQKARVYVKKTGFDPPPIKEKEKRLTGELTKFNLNQSFAKTFYENETLALLANLTDILEKETLDKNDKQRLVNLSQALSEIPNLKSSILKDLQTLINSKSISEAQKAALKTKLLTLLDINLAKSRNGNSTKNNKDLEAVFRKNMK